MKCLSYVNVYDHGRIVGLPHHGFRLTLNDFPSHSCCVEANVVGGDGVGVSIGGSVDVTNLLYPYVAGKVSLPDGRFAASRDGDRGCQVLRFPNTLDVYAVSCSLDEALMLFEKFNGFTKPKRRPTIKITTPKYGIHISYFESHSPGILTNMPITVSRKLFDMIVEKQAVVQLEVTIDGYDSCTAMKRLSQLENIVKEVEAVILMLTLW